MTTINYPINKRLENESIDMRTPNLSIIIPPNKGNIILGSE